jgi:hypothetical protein
MNCDDVGRILSESAAPAQLPEQVRQHLKTCPHCLNAARVLDASSLQDTPTATQLKKIEQAFLADLRPVRPLAHPMYRLAALITIFGGATTVGVWWLGTAGLSAMSRLQAAIILSGLIAGASLLAYSMAQQMTPGSAHGIAPRPLTIAIGTLLVITVALLFKFQDELDFWGGAWGCIRPGALIAVLTAPLLWLVLRRGAILSPALTGMVTGLLAGLAAATALEIRCPNLNAWHILASHLGTAGLSAFVGLAIGVFSDKPLKHRP